MGDKILSQGPHVQRAAELDLVVVLFPAVRRAVQLLHDQATVIQLVELFGPDALGSFRVAVEFGESGRQHKGSDASFWVDGLETGL